jgi:hypothetical protein
MGEDEIAMTAAFRDLLGRQIPGRIVQSDRCPLVAKQRRIAGGIARVAIEQPMLIEEPEVARS